MGRGGFYYAYFINTQLEIIFKEKVASGLYNNASEVVREALRFMKTNEELIYLIKLDHLRSKLAEGELDLAKGRYAELDQEDLGDYFKSIKKRAIDRVKRDKGVSC